MRESRVDQRTLVPVDERRPGFGGADVVGGAVGDHKRGEFFDGDGVSVAGWEPVAGVGQIGEVPAVEPSDEFAEFVPGLDGLVVLERGPNLLWLAFTMAGALLLIASWLTGPLPSDLHEITNILRSLTPVAAAMLVVACIGWRALGWLLSCPPARFVGKISFSLYLTHVPILIFSAYLFAGQPLLFAQIFGVCCARMVC